MMHAPVTREHREAWARLRYGARTVRLVPIDCLLNQWLTQKWLHPNNWMSCKDDERGAQAIADAEQREREWWESRIHKLGEHWMGVDLHSAYAGELKRLLEERRAGAKAAP